MSSNSQVGTGEMSDDGDLALLSDRLDYRFDNVDLLKRAVTHRSAASHHERKGHYERLEFLRVLRAQEVDRINAPAELIGPLLPEPNVALTPAEATDG